MNESGDFGVIVVCTEKDLIFAKGCCASIRYFMPEVRICLLVDGVFEYENLANTYDALVLGKSDIENNFLRNNSFGFGITKLLAFWESPFKYYLMLDADTVVWGDMRKHLQFDKFDIIVDKPKYKYSIEAINKYFFVVDKMKEYYKDFDYSNHPFFCPGVYFGKKNLLNLDEYKEILKFKLEHPDIMPFWEMSILNFLVFRMFERGELNIGSFNLQYIACDYPVTDTIKKFNIEPNVPSTISEPVVIHWPAEAKPVMENPHGYYGYEEPMRYFRKQYLKDSAHISEKEMEEILDKEEADRIKNMSNKRYKKRVINKIRSTILKIHS